MTQSSRKAKSPVSPGKAPGPANPRFAALIEALALDPAFTRVVADYRAASEAPVRRFGSNGLKANNKLFALSTQSTLVVKLPRDRVAALVAAGEGEPFDPGHGRLMKEWFKVNSPALDWLALVREAHRFVQPAPQ